MEGPAAGQVEADCQVEGLEEKCTDGREVTEGENPDVEGLAMV